MLERRISAAFPGRKMLTLLAVHLFNILCLMTVTAKGELVILVCDYTSTCIMFCL